VSTPARLPPAGEDGQVADPSVLFVNQGAMGTSILGLAASEAAFQQGLEGSGLRTAYLRLPPPSAAERVAAVDVPLLRGADLDLHALRWHLVESARGRRAAQRGVRNTPVTDVHVVSHTAGLLLASLARRRRVWLSTDATIRQWDGFGVWRPVRPWTQAALTPSVALERRAFRYAAGVLTWSRWAADGVLESCPEARVDVLHPGMDLQRWCPQPGAAARVGPLRVLFVGGRFREKGGEELLTALAPRLGRDVVVDVVTGDAVPARAGVAQHRIGHADPALVQLYRDADVFALPSFGDSLPWTVLEALAVGIPVVSTDVGGTPEVLGRSGERGLLVGRHDVAGLRAAIDALLADPARRRRMGVAGRSHVEEHYDVHRQGRALASLLREGR